MGQFLPPPGQPDPLMDPNFKSTSLPAITRFRWQDVDPPSPLYVLRDDVLLVNAVNNNPAAGETVLFQYRFLRTPEVQGGQPSDLARGGGGRQIVDYGIVESGLDVLTLGNGSSTATKLRTLGEGYLLAVTAVNVNGFNRGMVIARSGILRSGGAINSAAQMLFSDYITPPTPTGWPNGRILNSVEGPGWIHSVNVGNPAAGADWVMTVGSLTRRRVASVNAVFTAAVAVANRQVQLIVDDGVNVMGVFGASANITASTVANVTGTSGSTQAAVVGTDLLIPLPSPLLLEPSWRLRVATVGIQPADQWSAIWVNSEDWVDGI